MAPRKRGRKPQPKLKFKVSRKKLKHALNILEQPQEPRPTIRHINCSSSMLDQLNSTMHFQREFSPMKWFEFFRATVTNHDWDKFMKGLRLASQNSSFCGMRAILRATFFGILTLPIYHEPTVLKSLLYAIAPCRNEQDIEFCMETILRIFNGRSEPFGTCEDSTDDDDIS
ncbi:uncharacterized protein LOC131215004 [Anopheles bellator]|uniref:uncharacterized protein LOC131215004 n=1 Tax=Anopheles bellator TaxID=139047 RepID=UPI002647765B|nr:uncharacterized protein LOC131215004 [Anopheles bellator]